jgi:predicted enzyme related to lactoylglutathione lyase
VGANGGKVCNGPNEVPGPMWVAQCNDPQGAFFGLVSIDR